ncbi:MAG: thioredoxin domain-containing protein [Candidatus Anstonellaceae archaeon]
MLCFIALAVFTVLSLFSAKYRPLARRAFDCVLRKMTLRPCETGLDEEIKAKSLSWLMGFSPGAAGLVSRHFQAFSFAFTLLFFASIALTLQGVANFAIYGNCNGPVGGFCIYNGLQNPAFLKAPTTLQGVSAGNSNASITVFEFGCYTCPYTRDSEERVLGMLEKYSDRVHFVFKPFPLPNHPYSLDAAVAAACAGDAGKYWEYREALFANQSYFRDGGDAAFREIASRLNVSGFDSCYGSKKFLSQIESTLQEGKECGIYGTPTFFVNGKPFVGENAAADAEAEISRILGN